MTVTLIPFSEFTETILHYQIFKNIWQKIHEAFKGEFLTSDQTLQDFF